MALWPQVGTFFKPVVEVGVGFFDSFRVGFVDCEGFGERFPGVFLGVVGERFFSGDEFFKLFEGACFGSWFCGVVDFFGSVKVFLEFVDFLLQFFLSVGVGLVIFFDACVVCCFGGLVGLPGFAEGGLFGGMAYFVQDVKPPDGYFGHGAVFVEAFVIHGDVEGVGFGSEFVQAAFFCAFGWGVARIDFEAIFGRGPAEEVVAFEDGGFFFGEFAKHPGEVFEVFFGPVFVAFFDGDGVGGLQVGLQFWGALYARVAGVVRGALLRDVGEFVGEQVPPGVAFGCVCVCVEDDVVPGGVGEGGKGFGGFGGAFVGMDAYVAEVVAHALFHRRARAAIERLPRAAESVLDDGGVGGRWRGVGGFALDVIGVAGGHGGTPTLHDLCGDVIGFLFVAVARLADEAGGLHANIVGKEASGGAITQATRPGRFNRRRGAFRRHGSGGGGVGIVSFSTHTHGGLSFMDTAGGGQYRACF